MEHCLILCRTAAMPRAFPLRIFQRLETTIATKTGLPESPKWVKIGGQPYPRDAWFNIPPRIISLTDRSLHNQKNHPLWLIKQRIVDFMYKRHVRRTPNEHITGSSPIFSVHDNLSPVVKCRQNFDNLLIPPNHPSRSMTDTYYVNDTTLLRSHTSAHQLDLIQSGLDAFLLAGDVYRRDEVDALHYPVFHQMEGVRLFTADELFRDAVDPSGCFQLFEDNHTPQVFENASSNELSRAVPSYMLPPDRQPSHTIETAKRLEFELKSVLQAMAETLFGPDAQLRWIDAYFPFTHPSWELEVKTKVGYTGDGVEEWTEVLGCGLMRQELLEHAGVSNKVGYAFGLGLERWAMQLYGIPDIRLFWTEDSGFLHQFVTDNVNAQIRYKPVSVYPQCVLDLSFWLDPDYPSTLLSATSSENENPLDLVSKAVERDFYDLVRSLAGDLIEQVRLIDQFTDQKTGRHSHCYRLVYRDQHRTLTMDAIRPIHERVARGVEEQFGGEIR